MELYWNVLGDLLSPLESPETSLPFGSASLKIWCCVVLRASKSVPPTWFIISSTPSSYLLWLSPSTATPWKLGIKSGDGEGITCCLPLCSAGLFKHIWLKLSSQKRRVENSCWCCAEPTDSNKIWSKRMLLWGDLPVQINQISEGWKKKERGLLLPFLGRHKNALLVLQVD